MKNKSAGVPNAAIKEFERTEGSANLSFEESMRTVAPLEEERRFISSARQAP